MLKRFCISDVPVVTFKLAYLLLVMMNFTNFTSGSAFYLVYSYLVIIFGVALLLLRIVHFKLYLKTTGIYFMLGLVISYGVSTVLNYSCGGNLGLISNVKAVLWMCVHFFLLYAFKPNTKEALFREIKCTAYFITAFNFVSVLISYFMLLNNYSYRVLRGGKTIMFGIWWKRLWGTYTDPNHGGVVAVISILISLYFVIKCKKIRTKVFHIVNIVFSFMYITYSDSRTALVCLLTSITVWTALTFFYKVNMKKNTAVRIISCTMTAVFVAVAGFGIVKAIKPIGLIPRNIYYGHLNESESDKKDDYVEIGRNESDIVEEDISNRRFSIWNSGFEMFCVSPFFGTSFRNIVDFAKENVPDTYIINNDLGEFNCMHNSLFDVVLSQGIVGILLFLMFVICVFKNCFKYLAKKHCNSIFIQITLLSIVFAIATSSLFLSQIIYINSIGGAVFWIFLGYAMQMCEVEKKENA